MEPQTLTMATVIVLPDHLSSALRSTEEALLWVPSADETQLASTRGRAFSVVAPDPWNSFPRVAYLAPSLMSF